MRAAEQRPQIRSAEGEVNSLLWPSDDANAAALGRHDPDTAWTGAVDPANAVYL
jgi:hypothetical protein